MDRYRVNANAKSLVYKRRSGVQPTIFGFLLGSAVHLVSGPERFLIKRDPQATERAFEMIFRLILRPVGGGIKSWAVFRRQREWNGEADEDDPGCVLWYANWDHRTDLINESWRGDLSRETWREERFPAIQTTVRYLSERQCSKLGPLFTALDGVVVNGVTLLEVDRVDMPHWREFSLLRRFDWGVVDLIWSETRQNGECEYAGTALAEQIERLLLEELPDLEEVETLTMVFDWSPYFPDEVVKTLLTSRQ